MSEKVKRYSIVEYCGIVPNQEFENEEKYLRFLAAIKKINASSEDYFFGNVSSRKKKNGSYVASYHSYKRLTPKSFLKDLNEFTVQYTKKELKTLFEERLSTENSKIYIIYFQTTDEDKENNIQMGIKALPIFYKEDQKYLTDEYISKRLRTIAHNKDCAFIDKMCNAFLKIKKVQKNIKEVREAKIEVMYNMSTPGVLANRLEYFYAVLVGRIFETKEIKDYRKFVDVANLLRNKDGTKKVHSINNNIVFPEEQRLILK